MRSPCSSDASDCMSKLALASRPATSSIAISDGVGQHDRPVGQACAARSAPAPSRGWTDAAAGRRPTARRRSSPWAMATIRPSARWLATKWPSTSTRSSTMPEVAPRLTTTSFIASASKTQSPSRITRACIRLRWSSSYSPAEHGRAAWRGKWSSGMSVMKPRRPLVDADQRHAVARELPADAQHGAVAAHHQAQVALRADGRNVQRGVPCDSGSGRRFAFDDHLAALGDSGNAQCLPARHGVPHRARARSRGVVFADQGHLAELGFHSQITSLKSRKSLPYAR